MRLRWYVLLAAVFALAASACVKYETTINVNDDGSGFMDVLVAVDAGAFEDLAGLMGGFDFDDEFDDEFDDGFGGGFPSREEICADFRDEMTEVGPGVTVENYDDGTFCGTRIRTEFGPGDDAAATLDSVFGNGDDDLILRQEPDGGWRFELVFDPDEAGLGVDDELPPGFGDDLMRDASISFDVRLPGRPVDHNATEVDGNRFRWELSLTSPQSRLFAVTEPGEPDSGSSAPLPGAGTTDTDDGTAAPTGTTDDGETAAAVGDDDGSNLPLILGIVLAVLALAGVAFLLLRKRGDTALAEAGGPTWDEQRQAWVQYDAGRGGWLVFDDSSQEWRPMS